MFLAVCLPWVARVLYPPGMTDPRIEELRTLLPQTMLPDWVRLGSRLVRLLRDHHHPARHEEILNRLLAQARASVELRRQRSAGVPQISYPPDLPITARKDEIVAAIRAHQVVVVAGETGSGKTTQLPKMCLEAGLGIEAKVGCTQPRRVAALSISRRIAEELNVTWGREVGCKIRFDDRSSSETYLKLMTDGILLAETQGDPLLSEYNALIIDEAHERSLNIDFLLGYLKGLLVKRPELKLVITSATIDTQAFSAAFDHAPIIEVSGRLYPVSVAYAPFDSASEESGEMTYIDAAVGAAEQALCDPGAGDVLIFMPGERDIRETADQLEGRFGKEAEIIPLFGRLSAGEQQRVFAPAPCRKIVIATNIAETSLTIPGIRYVIDSGLARVSRYNPRTRTRRLPIEPISQSSANQRKGRSGRVQDGVCIRLYSEADFAARPAYTQPEIQRANLAEVILRMKAFRLGEIETFPFLNPPAPAAIQGGYKLLQELGALNDTRELTPLGRDLARLPIDPTLGRMLLQAQSEHAVRELLIIASGLSIQDPRERPLDQKDAAAAAHKRFVDPLSDFLTLLNIWNAVHEQWETLRTQNQRRKFCKANFLSYLRMREWQDLHAQLHDALAELGNLPLNESNAAYEAIHRSILAGLLGHLAQRAERNLYKTDGNRELNIFPGSVLFERGEKPKPRFPRGREQAASPPKSSQPEWLMAGEIVETSQLFARTVAGIEPEWIVALAPHLCRVTHQNPHWSATAGRVLVEERITLYGLELLRRKVAYGNIKPKEATEIFIRSALVEEALFPEPAQPRRELDDSSLSQQQLLASATERSPQVSALYHFLQHNRGVRQKIETWQTRSRSCDLGDLDRALGAFYAQHIENVSSVHELNRLLREHAAPEFLCVKEADLTGGQDLSYDDHAFPDAVTLASHSLPLSYAYSPGEEHDGVTVKLDLHLLHEVSPASVEWAIPGLREGQVTELLRGLPKTIRRELMPFAPKVAEIMRELRPTSSALKHDLARFIHQHYGIEIPPGAWSAAAVPQHLRPRVEVIGPNQKRVASSRDLGQLREQLQKSKLEPAADPAPWLELAKKWERFGLTGWSSGDLPERIEVPKPDAAAEDSARPDHPSRGAQPEFAWPGLSLEEGHVNLRLFRSPFAAREASLAGINRLIEIALQKDLGWLQKDLRALAGLAPLLGDLCSVEELQTSAFEHLKRHLLPAESFPVLAEAHFRAAVEQARNRLPGLGQQLMERLEVILKLRQEIRRRYAPAPPPAAVKTQTLSDLKLLGAKPVAAPVKPSGAASELAALLPKDFLERTPFERLSHFPRYLKALLIRAERAGLNPVKDQERARQILPWQEALRKFEAAPPRSLAVRREVEKYRWLLQEFKVSLFAQELGTEVPVSAKRLQEQGERVRAAELL
jgi:ATP-dependent helicase HrpA